MEFPSLIPPHPWKGRMLAVRHGEGEGEGEGGTRPLSARASCTVLLDRVHLHKMCTVRAMCMYVRICVCMRE